MELSAQIMGSIQADLERETDRLSRAVTSSVKEAGRCLKIELRRQVVSAGLGTRLSRTWREQVYPNKGHDAASLVWSKAPQIIRAFDEGALIRSKDGFFLAIPTPAAPKRIRGKRITPGRLEQAWNIRLRFIYRHPGPSLLVMDDARARQGKRPGFARASKRAQRTGQGLTTVVMFILVPQVRMPKKLDVERATRKWSAELLKLIGQRMQRR